MLNNSATRRVLVRNRAGIHARPSLAISNTVRQFQSEVQVVSGDRQVDGRDVLQLLTLGAERGAELVLSAKGPDAEQVLDALEKLFADNFGFPLD